MQKASTKVKVLEEEPSQGRSLSMSDGPEALESLGVVSTAAGEVGITQGGKCWDTVCRARGKTTRS